MVGALGIQVAMEGYAWNTIAEKKIMVAVTSYYQKIVRLMTAWLVYQKAEETETKW